jgi:hypothetical protein
MRTVAGLRTELKRIRERLEAQVRAREEAPIAPPSPLLAKLRTDPALPFRAINLQPDPWQVDFLGDESRRRAMLCCRRAGKSLVSAARTLRHCLTRPYAVTLVLSPTRRQSQEYVRYVRRFDTALGHPVEVVAQSLGETEWANGSRMICLSDSHEGVVGVGGNPTRVVIDEASRVSDVLYLSIRPMLALGAELEVLSTPFGKRGWFFKIFDTPKRRAMFTTWEISADKCPRITPEFLEEEKVELGERWFSQEYFLTFTDAIDSVFPTAVIEGSRGDGIEPLFDLGV